MAYNILTKNFLRRKNVMSQKLVRGHISAIITIIIWGTTFVSTKILLEDFQPIEILFFRFILGLLALYVVCPHLLVIKNKKEEITFFICRIKWGLFVLFIRKYSTYLYAGFKCGCNYFDSTFLYGFFNTFYC